MSASKFILQREKRRREEKERIDTSTKEDKQIVNEKRERLELS